MPKWLKRVLHYLGLAGNVHFLWTVGGATLLASLSGVVLPLFVDIPTPAFIGILTGLFLLFMGATSVIVRAVVGRWFVPKVSEIEANQGAWAAIFSQPVISNQHIYLADHCRWMGRDLIVGKTFIRCLLEGPAVLNSHGNVAYQNPLFEADEGIEQIFYGATGANRLNGVIGVAETLFVDCRFVGVGILTSDEDRDRLRRQFGDWSRAPYHPLFNAYGVPPVVPQRSADPPSPASAESPEQQGD